MTYLEAVELLREIEKKFDVMSIRYKGLSVWPYLRLYLLDQISSQAEIKVSKSVVRIVLRSLFAYNPLKAFRRYDIWSFTGCERRKQIGGKMIHRVSGGITACYGDECLMIEKPDLHMGHYNREEIEEKNIISESWLLLLFHLLQLVLRPFKPKIENEALMRQILDSNGLKFDYTHYVRSLNAKRLSLLWLMGLTRKPKVAMMEVPYDSMGYMWAFRQKGVKVIEMQHGVAGGSHNAYNGKAYEREMNPDGMCVYGSEEYRYFTELEPQYSPSVYMTGLYMLEKAEEYFREDIFENQRKDFDKVIVCSGQKGYEDELAAFVDDVARRHRNLFFVYIPRLSDTVLHFDVDNIVVAKDVNIYQYLKWCDVHVTISSTTCLEAQYFNKPTIFYDYMQRASVYYGKQLTGENGAFYIVKTTEFDGALEKLLVGEFTFKEIFCHHHTERICKVIKEIVNNE